MQENDNQHPCEELLKPHLEYISKTIKINDKMNEYFNEPLHSSGFENYKIIFFERSMNLFISYDKLLEKYNNRQNDRLVIKIIYIMYIYLNSLVHKNSNNIYLNFLFNYLGILKHFNYNAINNNINNLSEFVRTYNINSNYIGLSNNNVDMNIVGVLFTNHLSKIGIFYDHYINELFETHINEITNVSGINCANLSLHEKDKLLDLINNMSNGVPKQNLTLSFKYYELIQAEMDYRLNKEKMSSSTLLINSFKLYLFIIEKYIKYVTGSTNISELTSKEFDTIYFLLYNHSRSKYVGVNQTITALMFENVTNNSNTKVIVRTNTDISLKSDYRIFFISLYGILRIHNFIDALNNIQKIRLQAQLVQQQQQQQQQQQRNETQFINVNPNIIDSKDINNTNSVLDDHLNKLKARQQSNKYDYSEYFNYYWKWVVGGKTEFNDINELTDYITDEQNKNRNFSTTFDYSYYAISPNVGYCSRLIFFYPYNIYNENFDEYNSFYLDTQNTDSWQILKLVKKIYFCNKTAIKNFSVCFHYINNTRKTVPMSVNNDKPKCIKGSTLQNILFVKINNYPISSDYLYDENALNKDEFLLYTLFDFSAKPISLLNKHNKVAHKLFVKLMNNIHTSIISHMKKNKTFRDIYFFNCIPKIDDKKSGLVIAYHCDKTGKINIYDSTFSTVGTSKNNIVFGDKFSFNFSKKYDGGESNEDNKNGEYFIYKKDNYKNICVNINDKNNVFILHSKISNKMIPELDNESHISYYDQEYTLDNVTIFGKSDITINNLFWFFSNYNDYDVKLNDDTYVEFQTNDSLVNLRYQFRHIHTKMTNYTLFDALATARNVSIKFIDVGDWNSNTTSNNQDLLDKFNEKYEFTMEDDNNYYKKNIFDLKDYLAIVQGMLWKLNNYYRMTNNLNELTNDNAKNENNFYSAMNKQFTFEDNKSVIDVINIFKNLFVLVNKIIPNLFTSYCNYNQVLEAGFFHFNYSSLQPIYVYSTNLNNEKEKNIEMTKKIITFQISNLINVHSVTNEITLSKEIVEKVIKKRKNEEIIQEKIEEKNKFEKALELDISDKYKTKPMHGVATKEILYIDYLTDFKYLFFNETNICFDKNFECYEANTDMSDNMSLKPLDYIYYLKQEEYSSNKIVKFEKTSDYIKILTQRSMKLKDLIDKLIEYSLMLEDDINPNSTRSFVMLGKILDLPIEFPGANMYNNRGSYSYFKKENKCNIDNFKINMLISDALIFSRIACANL